MDKSLNGIILEMFSLKKIDKHSNISVYFRFSEWYFWVVKRYMLVFELLIFPLLLIFSVETLIKLLHFTDNSKHIPIRNP